MLEIVILILSLGLILLAAELFTNGVEWLGQTWGLSEGAVGSVLAAVGTALPETLVPIIAIATGGGREAATQIGIGAIVGAPFMLGTLAFFVTGVAAFLFAYRRPSLTMRVNREVMTHDLTFFVMVYSLAIITAFLPSHQIKVVIAFILIGLYVIYAWRTVHSGQASDSDLPPLIMARNSNYNPSLYRILQQVALALLGIVAGAHFFVDSVEVLAGRWGISPLILSLVIAPIATELPEKFNSILWVRKYKDTLALGNITGAMVFQSSIIPAIGIFLTPWSFTWNAVPLISAIFAISSASLVLLVLRVKGKLHASTLLAGGLFYSLFLLILFTRYV